MVVSFQSTNFAQANAWKQADNKAKSLVFGKMPTPESIERNKRIKRTNMIAMIAGTGIGATVGCLKFAQKLKAGVIGGLIGLVAGRLLGFLINPRVYQE